MKKSLLLTVSCLILASFLQGREAPADAGMSPEEKWANTEAIEQQSQKFCVLKLDDVVTGTNGQVVPERWQRVADFLERKKIKSSMGVIGISLVDDNPAYFQWIVERSAPCGYVEFWNHGFHNRSANDPDGEFERSFEEQMYSFRMTDSLAYSKMGLQFPVWGPHWSASNEDTDRALAQLPQIRMTFGYPPNAVHYRGFVFRNRIDFEHPTHNPDFEAFKKTYLKKTREWDYFFLQGHPNSWDTDTRWENFIKVIEYLEKEGVQFVTPTELYVILKRKGLL